MMGTNNSCFALIILLILSRYSSVQIEATDTKQTEALNNLYKAKLRGDSTINTDLFQANQILDVSEFYANEVGSKAKDRIDRLPGQPEVEFAQYGGYVTVDESAGRALYYYFVEAQPCNKSLPLLLWLNGGPGCSSLIGLWEELGPFRVYSDGKALYKNRYSWNYAANVLFLESPAGVGFSYSNTTSDYDKSGDSRTAEDNYVFLVNWLERFPEYKDKEFYISGESYAGHYVPQLAHTILHHNKKASKIIINLKGILIGNAVINDETDLKGFYEYFGSHALISKKVADNILRYCNFSPNATSQSPKCYNATDKLDHDLYYVDIYNIYAPSCFQNGTTAKPKVPSLVDFDPCSYYYVTAYLNRPDVQAAMHANVTKLSYDWDFCTQVLTNWTDSASTVLPLLKEFMANGLRVWIFSGDIDARVPFIGSQYSIDELKLEVKTEWHPWYIGGEVGGYTQVYKGDLTFATVREAGHMVPSYQPLRALSLIKHFLDGTPLPDTTRYNLIN